MRIKTLRYRQKRAAAVAGACLIGLGASPAAAQVFNPETFTLDNGLEVVVVANPASPAVNHMVWYKVGAADEPPGVSGIAHFVEHLMFRGTDDVPDGEFSRQVQAEGARSNAMTSWDFTGYFQNVAADRLGLMMELEADRMANLNFTEEVVEPERAVIIEERGQVLDSSPSARLSEQMYAALYQNHPYGIPIIGWRHEMEDLSVDDARTFYENWYAPNNAILILSGNIDAETARELASETYGKVPARDVPERVRPQEPEQAAEFSVTLRSDQVRIPSWRRFYAAPSYGNDPDGHAYALQVLSDILGSGTTSRLYQSLVVDQEVAVGAGTGYSASGYDGTTFAFYATPRGEADLDTVENAIDEEIAKLLDDGVDDEEVERAIQRLSTNAVFSRDSLMAPSYAFGRAMTSGLTVEDVEAWPERIAAVDVEAVNAAAEAIFDSGSVSGRLLPEDPDAAMALDEPMDPDAMAPEGPEELVQ